MAIGDPVNVTPRYSKNADGLVFPAGIKDHWRWIHDAPETADNAGGEVLAPLALASAAHRRIRPAGCSTAKFLLKYDDAVTAATATSPVIQVFGIARNEDIAAAASAGSYVPYRLVDADGTHALTLTMAATDSHDGTWKYTDWVEIDLAGAWEIVVAIKTALAVADGTVVGSQVLCQFS